MSESKRYSISQLSKEFGITSRTLRFYEEKGMIMPVREGQTRWYSNADRIRLKLILRGKRLGLSLEESHEIISMYRPDSDNAEQLQRLIKRIQDKKHEFEQQRIEIDKMIGMLNEYESRCQQALDSSNKKQN